MSNNLNQSDIVETTQDTSLSHKELAKRYQTFIQQDVPTAATVIKNNNSTTTTTTTTKNNNSKKRKSNTPQEMNEYQNSDHGRKSTRFKHVKEPVKNNVFMKPVDDE
jgi:hypothetical protein